METVRFELRQGLPYNLREGIALNKSSFYVLEDSWSAKGTQESPFGVVQVNGTAIETTLCDSSMVYIGGSPGDQLFCSQVTAGMHSVQLSNTVRIAGEIYTLTLPIVNGPPTNGGNVDVQSDLVITAYYSR